MLIKTELKQMASSQSVAELSDSWNQVQNRLSQKPEPLHTGYIQRTTENTASVALWL